ncbi:Rieske (2Fe-2S) protein [Paenibacillus humicola]|uniref:Rieske (2Fe-2S) protein n=1 Tax=Paenibacillus humicola TaxID=3110540 RepID=UPI00237A8272|nr:Rieske (2Fe-2S) protein [Paenibacillus humicola]
MERYVVCKTTEMEPGQRKIVQAGGRSIGVFNAGGVYYALRNSCPHQGAPLCLGRVTGTTLPAPPGTYRYGKIGEVLACPWHGWEFDVTTGKSLFNPNKCLVKTYDVAVEAAADANAQGAAENPEGEERLETYPVAVEAGVVVLYV